jgi:hypothetical protein
MKPHWFEVHEDQNRHRKGEWCKHCNTSFAEIPGLHFSRDELHDFVVAHGSGEPTEEGYAAALDMLTRGDPCATVAFEIVFRGLVA